MKILLIPAHHKNTPGKRSPDGKLREYAYSREIIERVIIELKGLGVDAENPIPETEEELSLAKQCRIVNSVYDECGGDCCLVSPHLNAASDGSQWMSARGWSVFISQNASKKSKLLAESLTKAAESEELRVRRQYPGIGYWVQSLAICRDTKCPACLTENLFQDNHEDVDFLLSEEGKQAIVNLHVQGIMKYLNLIENDK